MKRRTFVRNVGVASSALMIPNLYGGVGVLEDENYPLMDLHVHTTKDFTIDMAMELAKERNVKFGIVAHPHDFELKDDKDLAAYINLLKKYPVYVGLQPMLTDWSKNFSSELLNKLDYILMDPQAIPLGDGEYQLIYKLETYVEDIDAFMAKYLKHTLNILHTAPMSILGWPLFLPVCIAKDYYEIWTEERMLSIIEAAKSRNIAIEINDMAQTPHQEFILMAKAEGLKFTFGSDARDSNAGRLAYCKRIADECRLKKEDFYIPNGVNFS